MDYPIRIVSNQKEESISIKRVNSVFYHSLSEIFEGKTCYLLNFYIPLSVAEQAGLFKISENSGSCDEVILLTVPRQCFFCRFFLLFMFQICLYYIVLQPCGHLLGKG